MKPRQRQLGAVWPAAALVLLVALTAWPLILKDWMGGRPAYDQWNFHAPMIQKFVAEWPSLNFENYLSATTPLYHLVLAAVAKTGVLGSGTTGLRLAGSAFTMVLVGMLGWALARRGAKGWALFTVCGVFASSYYVWPAAAWLLPDNAAWIGVLAIMLLALQPRQTLGTMAAGGAMLALLVLTRQIHLWAAGVVWFAAWIGETFDDECEGEQALLPVPPLLRDFGQRVLRTIPAVALTLPAFGLVAAFAALWGGLVVPRYQGLHQGMALETPAFSLSLLAIYSVFLGGWLWPQFAQTLRQHAGAIVIAVLLGLLAAVLPLTTANEYGRKGGLWGIVAHAPAIAGHTSVVILVLAPCGAAALVLWLSRLSPRERWVMAIAWLGFLAAQTASPLPWQRYHEPFLLVWVAIAALWNQRPAPARWAVVGPALLMVGFIGLNAVSFGGGRVDQGRRNPLASPHYWGPPTPEPAEYTEERLPRNR